MLKIYNNISEFQSERKTIVTLGTFDGVHLGHRQILNRVLESAKNEGCDSLILTFFPHPRMVVQHESGIKLLNTIREKSQLLENAGIDHLVIHPFDKTFSRLSAEEFVRSVLVESFNLKKIVIGHDHRFGRNRTASIADLVEFGEKYDFEVEQIPAEEINSVSISSTKIREALSVGDMARANSYLGYNYFITGIVVEGKKLGRTLGFPTANISVTQDYKLIPAHGIYVVQSTIDGNVYSGMMSIGTNPTVNGTTETIEIYYFDLEMDLYGRELEVAILHWLRPEEKFDSLEALKSQLEKDRIDSLVFLKKS